VRYLLFVCTDPSAEPCDPSRDNIEEWVSDCDRKGIRLVGHRLVGVDRAVAVRVRQGQRVITDGPLAETKEWIAGFDLIECESVDQAIEVASRHPMARFGRIEVRPVWPTD
jgi:hypothetical protein